MQDQWDVLVNDAASLYIGAGVSSWRCSSAGSPIRWQRKRYMDGGGDPIGVAAYLGHTGSSIQLPQCLFADADSVEFDDGFSGNVSCLHKLTY
jgi:hypothetical protein